MENIEHVIEQINKRIQELQILENEYKKKNNTSGRLNAKTRRDELQQLKLSLSARLPVSVADNNQ